MRGAAAGRAFEGQTAVVTGAGRGIGRAVAHALAAGGARVAVVARSEAEIAAVARECVDGRGSPDARAFRCDVTDRAAVQAMARAVEEALGAPAILVNNAGSGESAPFGKMDPDFWRRMFAVNVDSAFHVTQAFIDGMAARGAGRVVNVASIAGKRGYPYITAYCAAKHALVGLTRALAAEYVKKGVTVNAVCPGYVDTPMTARAIGVIRGKTGKTEAETRDYLASTSPQGRIFTPEECADVIVALCTPGFGGVNGHCIHIDGGETQP